MKQETIFTPGQEAWTIWGEKVELLEHEFVSRNTIRFYSNTKNKSYLVGESGCEYVDKIQIIYPHPVQVVPIPEFEEEEEIEVSDTDFNKPGFIYNAIFRFKDKHGKIWCSLENPNDIGDWKFARKIKKEEPNKGILKYAQSIGWVEEFNKRLIELEAQAKIFADRLHIPESKL